MGQRAGLQALISMERLNSESIRFALALTVVPIRLHGMIIDVYLYLQYHGAFC